MEDNFHLENSFSMTGGEGELSYARNSSAQRNSLLFLQPFVQECIREMTLLPSQRFCIADMGCATGPNTLFVAETISLAVRKKYSSSSTPMPDLHVFFQDLPSNDFNSLLQQIHNNNNGTATPCKYYAAAVAGSFHKRLFPKRSLQFVHSSYSLHWLSRVPPEIEDRNSRCWNGKGVFISKGAEEVAGAYLRQFQQDLRSFLRARGEEVVVGGRMFLLMAGREGRDPTEQCNLGCIGEILKSALEDVVALGVHLIDRRTVEKFNLPFFAPCVEEVRGEVEKEGSFRVIRMQFVREVVKSEDVGMENEESGVGKIVANRARAALEWLIASHFGEEVVDAVFERYAVRAQEKASSLPRIEVEGIFTVLEPTPISIRTLIC